jgi:hypothetical protein
MYLECRQILNLEHDGVPLGQAVEKVIRGLGQSS